MYIYVYIYMNLELAWIGLLVEIYILTCLPTIINKNHGGIIEITVYFV